MYRYDFDESILTTVAGGKSVIDLPRLAIHNETQATSFLLAYGFDLQRPEDVERLWYFYRRALVLLDEKLGFPLNTLPEVLRDRKNLEDPRRLLFWASARFTTAEEESAGLQRWSCALLRAIHVFLHAESDLFASFSEEIQKQILTPFQQNLFTEGSTGITYLRVPPDQAMTDEQIELSGFEVKPFKTTASTVTKLLAKSDAVAMRVFDKLGVRFITHSIFDTFRVIRFLVEHNLVSYPHIMPDQSSNNLYPVELFSEICQELAGLPRTHSEEQLEALFLQRLDSEKDRIQWLRKANHFSGQDYRFIKFISRKLVRIPRGDKGEEFSFFFPYEVQIMDRSSYGKIQNGPSEHQYYKERQRQAARRRLFPDLPADS